MMALLLVTAVGVVVVMAPPPLPMPTAVADTALPGAKETGAEGRGGATAGTDTPAVSMVPMEAMQVEGGTNTVGAQVAGALVAGAVAGVVVGQGGAARAEVAGEGEAVPVMEGAPVLVAVMALGTTRRHLMTRVHSTAADHPQLQT
jgi:hypothetical protein